MKQENKELLQCIKATFEYLSKHSTDPDMDGINRDINTYVAKIDKALAKAEAYDILGKKGYFAVTAMTKDMCPAKKERYGLICLENVCELSDEEFNTFKEAGN